MAPIAAGKPYIAYINEGNFLHPVVRILREGGWDSRSYDYPQFPRTVVAALMRVYARVYALVRGKSLKPLYSPEPGTYDVIEPFALLVVARVLSVLVSMGIVVLTGILAYRLAGQYAGAVAVSLAAVTPALVVRSGHASVDPYAAIFVIACLTVTEASRTSSRPHILSFWAGFLAGCAFASKYPAAMVVTAFGVTTLLQPIAWAEKMRRCALAAVGLFVGMIVAMPAVITHTHDVYEGIRYQVVSYAGLTTPSLWQQAVHKGEPDMPYTGSELGAMFLVFAAIGFGISLMERRWTSTIWGWLAFMAGFLALFGYQPYQPFRNLLPLVPLLCIAISLLCDRVRVHISRPSLVDAVGMTLILVFLALPSVTFAWERIHVVDARTTVADWLVANARPNDSVVLIKELGFVNSELARLPSPPRLESLRNVDQSIIQSQAPFVVAGVFLREDGTAIDVASLPSIAASYVLRFRAGQAPVPPNDLWWHGNQEIVYVFERKTHSNRPINSSD
jgi:hypothetical protein